MVKYKIVGKKKGKAYVSRKRFSTEKAALKYGYKLTYTASGKKKRKNQLSNWRVKKARR